MIPREGQESLGGQRQLIAMGEAGLHWGGGKSRQQATTLGVFILHNPVYHQYIFLTCIMVWEWMVLQFWK